MDDFKIIYICNCILRAVAFICITTAAIYFLKTSLLWWYIVPALMGLPFEGDNKNE